MEITSILNSIVS